MKIFVSLVALILFACTWFVVENAEVVEFVWEYSPVLILIIGICGAICLSLALFLVLPEEDKKNLSIKPSLEKEVEAKK